MLPFIFVNKLFCKMKDIKSKYTLAISDNHLSQF